MRVDDFSDDIINSGEEETLFTKRFASLRLVLGCECDVINLRRNLIFVLVEIVEYNS